MGNSGVEVTLNPMLTIRAAPVQRPLVEDAIRDVYLTLAWRPISAVRGSDFTRNDLEAAGQCRRLRGARSAEDDPHIGHAVAAGLPASHHGIEVLVPERGELAELL